MSIIGRFEDGFVFLIESEAREEGFVDSGSLKRRRRNGSEADMARLEKLDCDPC